MNCIAMLRVWSLTFKPVNNLISVLQDRFDVGGKTRNIAIQFVLQECCKTSCMFFSSVLSCVYKMLLDFNSEIHLRKNKILL